MTSTLGAAAQGSLDPEWTKADIPDRYTVVTVGDIIVSQPMLHFIKRQSPDLLAILENADLVVGNFEGSVIDLRHFDGYPEAESGFSWLIASPEVAPDLKDMGFDMLARANNHATDWGVPGMLMTDDLLSSVGLSLAGTGSSLTAARAPAYSHGDKASASLVAWTTTYEKNSPAIDAQGQINARPGASTLHAAPIALVSHDQLQAIRNIRDSQPKGSIPQVLLDIDNRLDIVTLFGQRYKAKPASSGDTEVTVSYSLDQKDLDAVLLNVRQAKQTSDFTVVSSHTHEPNNWTDTPPDFFQPLAYSAIANGADLVCGHGPHQLRGIEVHDGKPIFYSLGDFSFMENARAIVPRDEWERRIWNVLPGAPDLNPDKMTAAEFMEWTRVAGVFSEEIWFESVIAASTFDASGHVTQIRLYPIELGHKGRDARRGIPMLASPENGVKIMERLQQLSAPYGTEIHIDAETGIGMIKAQK